MNLLADIFVTVKDRYALAEKSLSSLFACTERSQFRLTVMWDGGRGLLSPRQEPELIVALSKVLTRADYIISSRENEGLGPTINRAVAHVCSINEWYGHPTHGDQSKVANLICMCQDDLLYTPDWLPRLAETFYRFEGPCKLGFASGLECVEHPQRADLGNGIILKDWIRAAQMLGRRDYWRSLMPIPRLDHETGRVRARPNDGMGSSVDWWLLRNHENSVCRTGRTCLVMPGLVQHAGYDKSTWLKRELPESDSDKAKVKELIG